MDIVKRLERIIELSSLVFDVRQGEYYKEALLGLIQELKGLEK